jgi:hypothetical protein
MTPILWIVLNAPKRRWEGARGASVKPGLGGGASGSPCPTELVVNRIAWPPRPDRSSTGVLGASPSRDKRDAQEQHDCFRDHARSASRRFPYSSASSVARAFRFAKEPRTKLTVSDVLTTK